METLHFKFNRGKASKAVEAIVVGVVSSGNLEIMVEPKPLKGACHIDVTTSATGFEKIWEAVLRDFFERHRPANLHISINDVGATPAVVSLRLDQAMQELAGGEP
jgi:malonate decarboxylase delta subunit